MRDEIRATFDLVQPVSHPRTRGGVQKAADTSDDPDAAEHDLLYHNMSYSTAHELSWPSYLAADRKTGFNDLSTERSHNTLDAVTTYIEGISDSWAITHQEDLTLLIDLDACD